MAKISRVTAEITPEHVNIHFDTLPRLEIMRFGDPKPNFAVVGVTEVTETVYLRPISLYFNGEHYERIERAVQAFNAAIAESDEKPVTREKYYKNPSETY